MVALLQTIPGCGPICAWTIRAYTDDIKRFSSHKKYASFAGLAPWVQNSNETVRHGNITKRGPRQLRTALVQVVMGWRWMKSKTLSWRLMRRYEAMKKSKGSGKSIIAAARKLSTISWHMVTDENELYINLMVDKKLAKKSESISLSLKVVEAAMIGDREKPMKILVRKEDKKKSGVAGKKIKKVG
jgi:hypothetical protein